MKVFVLTKQFLVRTKAFEVDVAGVFTSITAAAKYVAESADYGPKKTQALIEKWNNETGTIALIDAYSEPHGTLWELSKDIDFFPEAGE